MNHFWKGIIVGIGGVAPGLSGSVLLIIFGLYQKTLEALGTLLVSFKKNIRFLGPLVAGMFVGVLLFSKVVDFFLNNYEMPTRFCFLGLILGTLPMVHQEMTKEGFSKKYYLIVVATAAAGLWFFSANPHLFPEVTNPTFLHSVVLGVVVAAATIIPGVEPSVIMSSLGLYELYIASLADVNLRVLLPMLVGLAFGAVGISYGMSVLFKRHYAASFAVIFGIFLAMIPSMLNESCVLVRNGASAVSLVLLVVGFWVSYYLGDIEENNRRLKVLFGREDRK